MPQSSKKAVCSGRPWCIRNPLPETIVPRYVLLRYRILVMNCFVFTCEKIQVRESLSATFVLVCVCVIATRPAGVNDSVYVRVWSLFNHSMEDTTLLLAKRRRLGRHVWLCCVVALKYAAWHWTRYGEVLATAVRLYENVFYRFCSL